MFCSVCGTEMIGGVCSKCNGGVKSEGAVKQLGDKGIKLVSPEPLDDGLKKFNILYGIAAVASLFFGDTTLLDKLGCVVVFCIFALAIKWFIAVAKCEALERREYALPIGITEEEIIAKITIPLTSVGMVVEKDFLGFPIIRHNRLKYSVSVNQKKNTFSIECKKQGIKAYRKIVVSEGIIAYTIQQETLR